MLVFSTVILLTGILRNSYIRSYLPTEACLLPRDGCCNPQLTPHTQVLHGKGSAVCWISGELSSAADWGSRHTISPVISRQRSGRSQTHPVALRFPQLAPHTKAWGNQTRKSNILDWSDVKYTCVGDDKGLCTHPYFRKCNAHSNFQKPNDYWT